MTSLGHVIVWRMKHKKGNKHKSCEHREHGGRDQSQVKMKYKKFEKIEVRSKDVPKSHNDDNPPPPTPLSTEANLEGTRIVGFDRQIYCTSTNHNPSTGPTKRWCQSEWKFAANSEPIPIKTEETYLVCTSSLLPVDLSIHTKYMISMWVSVGVSIHQHLVIWILGGLLIVVL